MIANNAPAQPDDLHPSVVMTLEKSEYVLSLAEHFPDIYRILNQYADLLSTSLSNEQICERILMIAERVQQDLQMIGCIPSDARLITQFAAALTKDACSFDTKNAEAKSSPKRAERILTKSARRVMARQRVAAHA